MTAILTTARLVFKDAAARQKAIDAFHKIIEFTTPHEPEVLQYANQAASDAHLTTKPVQDLIQLFTTGDVLAQPPEVHNCPIITKKTSSPVPISSNPAIVLMNIPSKPDASSTKEAEKWSELSQIVMKSVKGVNSFTVVADREAKSTRVECVLQSWDSFAAYQEFMVDGRRDGADVVKIRPIYGFTGRDSSSKL
ncbi:uncharacterized protein J4E88_007207 [Alternaria novae-zelandiae]|uniref:uncharacterized protein n=1 Tax=Alternaria novae-zelandiae TaxID=430562 RepID=UPI0020C3AF1B|nr:uncharacterized protein J4E88_007207 [Alternaria novae-zelandiae]KAI4676293.1 hypothetical protein J4E88_007207 [Alternaria novae-zelandiae]